MQQALDEKCPAEGEPTEQLLQLALHPIAGQGAGPADSAEEGDFLDWVVEETELLERGWCVAQQVFLSALTRSVGEDSNERVDFLFTNPTQSAFVVEVDGDQHQGHVAGDAARDAALAAGGVHCIRVPAAELRAGQGPALAAIRGRLSLGEAGSLIPRLALAKFAHQLQLALLEAVRGGWVDLSREECAVKAAIPKVLVDSAGQQTCEAIAEAAAADLLEILSRLGHIHGKPIALSTVVRPNDGNGSDGMVIGEAVQVLGNSGPQCVATFAISDFPVGVEAAAPTTPSGPVRITEDVREHVEWFLRYLFRKPAFWEGQWEAIDRTLRGLDSVVLLPTGGGKSIAFQLSALLLPGRCLVVDPIVSLIDDQIDNLRRVGIDRAVGISSQIRETQTREALVESFASGAYLFCYVAPERLQMTAFRDRLRTLTAIVPVSLVAIDEAHCVSEWGHDFRTAYLNLGRNAREFCSFSGSEPPLVALTGTASRIVLKDVQRELGITDYEAIITPTTFDRQELSFHILRCRSDEKIRRVSGFIESLPGAYGLDRSTFLHRHGPSSFAGLVFCPFVNGENGVAQRAGELRELLGVGVETYAGSPPRGFRGGSWDVHKQTTAKRFKRDELTLLACTKAFGMGIDKPNIRYTVHTGLPESIESFYQEAGRAGRDRSEAHCAIVLSDDDPRRSVRLLSPNTPVEELAAVVKQTKREDSDDVLRALWFHADAFRGKQAELADMEALLERLGETETRRRTSLSWRDGGGQRDDDNRSRLEKSLHRLVVLKVVEDYTLDYGSGEFEVQIAGATREEAIDALAAYVGAYQRGLVTDFLARAASLDARGGDGFVRGASALLIDFIYDHIEKARRRSLAEMLDAASKASDGEELRARVLSYLQTSEFDDDLDEVVSSGQGGLETEALQRLLDGLVSQNDAANLRGAVARYLTSYPDVPGLLLLRAVTEALCRDVSLEVMAENAQASVTFALRDFQVPGPLVGRTCGAALACVSRRPDKARLMSEALAGSPQVDRGFLRSLLEHSPEGFGEPAKAWLMTNLATATRAMLSREGERSKA